MIHGFHVFCEISFFVCFEMKVNDYQREDGLGGVAVVGEHLSKCKALNFKTPVLKKKNTEWKTLLRVSSWTPVTQSCNPKLLRTLKSECSSLAQTEKLVRLLPREKSWVWYCTPVIPVIAGSLK
jgi:hypothetical protein